MIIISLIRNQDWWKKKDCFTTEKKESNLVFLINIFYKKNKMVQISVLVNEIH